MLAGGKLLSFGLSTNWERELLRADLVRELGEEKAARIDPTYPKGNPIALHPGRGFEGDGVKLAEQIGRVREQIGLAAAASGSNNWAVRAERSATDGALLAGDPHLSSGMPGFWYQLGLELDGRACRGASIPGLPGISMGQNDDLAWTFTNVMADVEDLFVERIEADSYEFQGEWRPLEIIEELITIRGEEHPERHEVRLTHHGPIVNSALGADDEQPLALRWAALDEPAISRAHVSVLEPRSGPELVELLRDVTMPVSNLVWADRHGSIGYKMMGRIPRRRGDCPDLPKPGWTEEFEWEGWVTYEELPELVDPDEGYIVTANNRVVDDSYPHHITSDWLDGYRARRVEQLLGEREEHDLDSFQRMQTDLYSIPGDQVVHRLARLEPGSQREIRAIERLKSWDRRLEPGTVAGTIYEAFLLRLATATSPSATSTAPTTASSPTSPHPGAGIPSCSRSGRRETRS
jgi:penicillin amidase